MNGDDFPGILLNKYEERKMTSEEVKYWDPLEHVNAEKYKELTEKHPGLMRRGAGGLPFIWTAALGVFRVL